MFIGGMIYDDFGNENDTEIEKKRIERYLKAVCKSVGGIYPVDLHVNEGNDQKVKEVKTKISETFGSFLKHGSYKDIDEETKKELKKLQAAQFLWVILLQLFLNQLQINLV